MKNAKPYTPHVFRIISSNIAKWGNPLGLKKSDCAAWANGLQLPSKGKIILYTGCEYQMTAYMGGGFGEAAPIVYTCLRCGRCTEMCPQSIDVSKLIPELRRRIVNMARR